MVLRTDRLTLRPWELGDAPALYKYASDERVGTAAGWPPHESVEESAEIIRTVFSNEGVFALTLKDSDEAIGCAGFQVGEASNFPLGEAEAEIGYWIGVPFWGRGLVPEAVRELARHGFEELGYKTLWCGYFDGNNQSKRAQEKCGFKFVRTDYVTDEVSGEKRLVNVSRLTRDEWAAAREPRR